jgi:hypothetical protein
VVSSAAGSWSSFYSPGQWQESHCRLR